MNAKVGLEEGNVKKLIEFLNGDLDPVYRIPIQNAIKNVTNTPYFVGNLNDASKRESPELDKSRLLRPGKQCTRENSPKVPKVRLKELNLGKSRRKCLSVMKERYKHNLESIKGYFEGKAEKALDKVSAKERELVLEKIIVFYYVH